MADGTEQTRGRGEGDDGGSANRGGAGAGAGGEDGNGAGSRGSGRRLEVRVQPAVAYATWWFLPQGDGLRQAAMDDPTPSPGGLRSVLCGFGGSVPERTWWAWPVHPDRPYAGADTGRLLLAVSDAVAASFHPGRPVDIGSRHRRPGARPVPGGVLDGAAAAPVWLPDALHGYHRSRASGPIIEARHRWQSKVDACSVTPDGRELWCTVSSYRDEALAGFDVEQTAERITVRAWLAFGPDGPTTFGTGRVRTLSDGRRLRTMYRQGGGRRWSTVVHLDQPLGARPVVDVALPEPDGAGQARRAWLAARE